MIPPRLLDELASLEGYLTRNEGGRLAELASGVPVDHAIVEVGSFKGKSACFLGIGSKMGASAPVFAVDVWELHPDPKFSSPDVFRRWREQITRMELTGSVTPIRCESHVLGPIFSHPIGLLFIDGDHDYDSVASDFYSWSSKVVEGGVLAFHDYRKPRVGQGVTRFVDEQVLSSEEWSFEEVVDSLLVVRRVTAPRPDHANLTFVENRELEKHLALRPAQYGLDLSLVVPKRNADGIFVDTHSPHHRTLVEKYRTSQVPPPPLEARVREMCDACPVGARCKFPRLPFAQRKEILESRNPEVWNGWCETKAWGGEIDFVYPYISAPSRGEELRFSLRSIEKHFVGTPRVWVVGDRPDWYEGNHLSHARIPECRHRPRFDQVAKLRKMLKEKRIRDEFVWMMDDVYFLEPVTLQELRKPWMRRPFDREKLSRFHASNNWLLAKKMTWEALDQKGLPLDDMAAHMPYVYEKTKLRRILKEYRLDKNPYVLNLLYYNVYADFLPQHSSRILRRDHGQGSAEAIRDRLKSALILNHPDEGYTPAMEELLFELFPNPSRFEHA